MGVGYQGSCLCDSVHFEVSGEIESFYLCHCTRCQKGTGTAHAANLFIKSGTLNWLKGGSEVKRFKLTNSLHTRSFCQHCGSPLPTYDKELDYVVIPAGSLDCEVNIKPTAKIFMDSRADWVKFIQEIAGQGVTPEFGKLPDNIET